MSTCSNSIIVLASGVFFFSPHPPCHLPLFTEKPNFCYQEKDPGICRGFFSRYFYNKETKICEIFKYGGCLGNQNNFKSLEECQTTCQGNRKLLSSLFVAFSSINSIVFWSCLSWGKKNIWGDSEMAIIYTRN